MKSRVAKLARCDRGNWLSASISPRLDSFSAVVAKRSCTCLSPVCARRSQSRSLRRPMRLAGRAMPGSVPASRCRRGVSLTGGGARFSPSSSRLLAGRGRVVHVRSRPVTVYPRGPRALARVSGSRGSGTSAFLTRSICGLAVAPLSRRVVGPQLATLHGCVRFGSHTRCSPQRCLGEVCVRSVFIHE